MDADAIEELFSGLGPVTIKRMFGGKGIYRNGLIVAIDLNSELMLKADRDTAPLFEAAGARQWHYPGRAGKKPVFMPYWSIPDQALDDPDEMTRWARLAYDAAVRSARSG
ncbi:TfoX/Sxy family protein [Rhizobium sp. Leaf341]|uniref:TfoX/Sxy family protein n=1 Tax=Rhizobium sp. Leaf341 TaxID=1736344 RepID=UPI000715CBB0|nr:TfoX/Sxy family protein [Rhizobium sp. Leaf341]KQR68730.1 competence protein TfoX [Rhizobium sp. Leaf341]